VIPLGAEGDLRTIIEVAGQLGAEGIANEAVELQQRLSEGRFYVACVGQFKRGKSTLLNALIGQSVLPVGVVPVTSVITVLRYGERLNARVRFGSGDWQDIEPTAISAFVSEAENPENQKGVSGVEVFVHCNLLRSGMCLVDTPGLGSVFAGNTEATREFVPHIDAAMVVLGADPPLSGVELDLVEETAKHIHRLVLVLSKTDKLSEEERREGRLFAESVLRRRLGREVGPILEVSAVERVKDGPTRDWPKLETVLLELTSAQVVKDAEERGVRRLASKLLREIDEHRDALVRPQEVSDRRIERLRLTIAEAERTLTELDYLFKAVHEGLAQTLDKERESFLRNAIPTATVALDLRIEEKAESSDLPTRGMELAQEIACRAIDEWRRRIGPTAEALYSKAVTRFVEIANDFLRQVGNRSDPALASLPDSFDPDVGFRTKPHFAFTYVMTLAAPKLWTRVAGITRDRRIWSAKKNAREYLVRLMTTNSARVVGDLADQVLESRRRVQAEVRDHLRALVRSAETAASRATEFRARGDEALRTELVRCDRLRTELVALMGPTPSHRS
jgi:GTP-binding protein EngB required for normal cell division